MGVEVIILIFLRFFVFFFLTCFGAIILLQAPLWRSRGEIPVEMTIAPNNHVPRAVLSGKPGLNTQRCGYSMAKRQSLNSPAEI